MTDTALISTRQLGPIRVMAIADSEIISGFVSGVLTGHREIAVAANGGGAAQRLEHGDVGGTVIVQNEDSSVVWGMPRAVAEAGLCSAVPSLKAIPSYLGKAATVAKA